MQLLHDAALEQFKQSDPAKFGDVKSDLSKKTPLGKRITEALNRRVSTTLFSLRLLTCSSLRKFDVMIISYFFHLLQMRDYSEKQRLQLAAKSHPHGWFWYKTMYTGDKAIKDAEQKLMISPEQLEDLRVLTPYERSIRRLDAGSEYSSFITCLSLLA